MVDAAFVEVFAGFLPIFLDHFLASGWIQTLPFFEKSSVIVHITILQAVELEALVALATTTGVGPPGGIRLSTLTAL